jgi:hypothetical protein
LPDAKTEGKFDADILAFTKEGIIMRLRLWFPALALTALALLLGSVDRVRAGSFFGPCCYGSSYAYEYPNRARNLFGCGPCSHCTARHPLFGRLFHKNQAAPVDAMPASAPMTATPPLAAPLEAIAPPAGAEPPVKAPF